LVPSSFQFCLFTEFIPSHILLLSSSRSLAHGFLGLTERI
jgi:hypothetical protein